MSKVIGDIAISVDAETAGLIKGLQAGKVSVSEFGLKVEQMGKRIKAAETQTRSMGGAFRRFGNVSRQARARIQNTSYQLQDMAVQLEMGTAASRVMAQQLPQLAGGFGPVGAAIGVLAGVGIPLMVAAFGDMGKAADEAKKKMETVADAQKRLNQELRQMASGATAEEIILQDQIRASMIRTGDLQAKISSENDTRRRQGLKNTLAAVEAELSGYQEQLTQLRYLQEAKKRFLESTMATADAERAVWAATKDTGQSLAENETIAQLLREGLKASTIEAMQLAGVDMASGIDAAALAAGKMAQNLNIAYQQAVKLRAMASAPLNEFGGEGSQVNHDFNPFHREITPLGSTGGGGGGGGSLQPELDALREKYATEQEMLDTKLATDLEKLEQFRQAKLLKDGEYDALEAAARKQHLDDMSKLEAAARDARLQSVSGALGDLATLMQSGNAKLFKIGQAAAVADAVVSGYGAAVAAWEKGMKVGGPPVAAAFTAASLAKTGALISGITSASANGAGGGAAAGGSVAEPQVQTREVQVAEFRFSGDVVSPAAIIDAINQAADDGYTIRASLA